MTYIFGHKNPDTDSTVSAVALSYLKNELGQKTYPYVLGPINREADYVLDLFQVEKPPLLTEVNPQISDLDYERLTGIGTEYSILAAYKKMEEEASKILAIVGPKNELLGVVTMKNIAMGLIQGDFFNIETSTENILQGLNGQLVCGNPKEVKGRITVAAFYRETLVERNIITPESIVIVGDRFDVIEHAILKKANLLVVTGGAVLPDSIVELAHENGVTVIVTDYETYMVSKLIHQCNYITSIMKSENLIEIQEDEYLDEVAEILATTGHSNYPVVNTKGRFLGFMGRRHILKPKRKKVILVDHNEYSQSVDGLKEAHIIEIVDHHKLGDITTNQPIAFTNIPVGSTSTIIYGMYRNHGIEIPKNMAGLMISGILSDTLYFRSPTTTDVDRAAVESLNNILKLDLEAFTMDMFKAGTSLEGQSAEEIFFKDFKDFDNDHIKIGVSQVFTLDIEDVLKRQEQILSIMSKVHDANHYTVTVFFVTDILKNGSYVFFKSEISNLMNAVFERPISQGTFVEKVVSRKKQVIPRIFDELSKLK